MANGKITSASPFGPSLNICAERSAPVAFPALREPGKATKKIIKRIARHNQKLAAKKEEEREALANLLKGGRILESLDE